MALLYFDGFDQYASIPEPTATNTCTIGQGIANQQSVPTDLSIIDVNAYWGFCKLYGEDRVWRIQYPSVSPGTKGSHNYSHDRASPAHSVSYSSYAASFNTLRPLTEHKKLVVGYKVKFAESSFRIAQGYSHVLAAFSSTSAFQTPTSTFAVVLESGNVVALRTMSTSTGYIYNQAIPTASIAPGDNAVLGTCNFIVGSSGGNIANPCIPPIEQLAANTVEIEVTDAGKVTVWINNQYVGACTIVAASYIQALQYVKLNFMYQYYTSSSSITSFFCFNGMTDMYVLNGLGPRNTTRLGKVKVVSRLPTSDAGVQFQRPVTAATNSDVASNIPPVIGESLTGVKEGDTDLYASNAFNFTNEYIVATSVMTSGYKTDPSGNDIAPVLNVSGTNYVGNTNIVPISSTKMKTEQHIYELNPKTNLPFTKTDLDATKFGVTVVAPVIVEE